MAAKSRTNSSTAARAKAGESRFKSSSTTAARVAIFSLRRWANAASATGSNSGRPSRLSDDQPLSGMRNANGALAWFSRPAIASAVAMSCSAVVRAVRYAGSLRPTELRAVHISLDNDAADALHGRASSTL